MTPDLQASRSRHRRNALPLFISEATALSYVPQSS